MGEHFSNSPGSVFIVIRVNALEMVQGCSHGAKPAGRSTLGVHTKLATRLVSEWDDLCAAWEADKVPKMTLNPFCVLSDGRLVNSLWIYRYSYSSVDLTEDQVHKELAEEEEARRRSGRKGDSRHESFGVHGFRFSP